MGRPTKLTPEVQQRIVTAIAAGNAEETAAEYAGIAPSTFFRWMSQGAKPRAANVKREFREAVLRARVEAEVRHVLVIETAVKEGDWRASAWWLERQRHNKWGKKESLEITIRREAGRLAKETGLDVEEIMAEAERLVKP